MAAALSPELLEAIQEFTDLVLEAPPPADVCNNYGKLAIAARQHGNVDVKDLLDERVVQRFGQILSGTVVERTLAHVAKAGHGWQSVCLLDLVQIFGSAILSVRHNDAHKCLRALADAGISLTQAEVAISAAYQHRQLQGQSQGVKRSSDPALVDFRTALKTLLSHASRPILTDPAPPEINAKQSHTPSGFDAEKDHSDTRGRGDDTPHPAVETFIAKRLSNVLAHGPRKRRRLKRTTSNPCVNMVDGVSRDLDGGASSPELSVEIGRGLKNRDQWYLFDNHDMSTVYNNSSVPCETDSEEESNFSAEHLINDDDYGHCNQDDAESAVQPDHDPHTPESLPPMSTEHGKPQHDVLRASRVAAGQQSATEPRIDVRNEQLSYDPPHETVPAIGIAIPTKGQQSATDEIFSLQAERSSQNLSQCSSPTSGVPVTAGNSTNQQSVAELKYALMQQEDDGYSMQPDDDGYSMQPRVEKDGKTLDVIDIVNQDVDEQAVAHDTKPGGCYSVARATLCPQQWLSSSVFTAVFETFRRSDTHIFDCLYMSASNSHIRTFSTCKTLKGYKKFLIPLHHVEPVRHWTIAFVDLDDGVISYYDSLGHVNNSFDGTKLILTSFFERSDLIITQMDGPRQTNSYDCGILAIVVGLARLFDLEIPEQVNCEIWRKVFIDLMDYNLVFACPDGDGVRSRVVDYWSSKTSVQCHDFANTTEHTRILQTLHNYHDIRQTELDFVKRIVNCNSKHFRDEQSKVRDYQEAVRQTSQDEEAILQLSTIAQPACLAALREVVVQAKGFVRRFAACPARSAIIIMLENEVDRMITRGRDTLNEIEKVVSEEQEELRKTNQRRQERYVRLIDLLAL